MSYGDPAKTTPLALQHAAQLLRQAATHAHGWVTLHPPAGEALADLLDDVAASSGTDPVLTFKALTVARAVLREDGEQP